MSTGNKKFKVIGFRIGGETQQESSVQPDIRVKKRYTLEIKSDKRSNSGFHIFQDYENAIEKISLISMHRNKGRTLEFLVDFYLSRIPEERLDEILKLIERGNDADQEDW